MIRPDLRATLLRWREVIAAVAVALTGLWLATRGGWLLAGVGAVVTAAGGAAALIGIRRLRFAQGGAAPGVVGVIEGQLTYMGPATGGFLAMDDLACIALVNRGGLRCWELTPATGPALLVPVAASGAHLLFDAFAALPGLDMAAVLAALDNRGGGDRVLWQRTHRLLLG